MIRSIKLIHLNKHFLEIDTILFGCVKKLNIKLQLKKNLFIFNPV